MRPNVQWDESAGQWSARYPDGTFIYSPSLSELEQFLDLVELRNQHRRSSNRQAALTWAASVVGMLLIVAVSVAAALLW